MRKRAITLDERSGIGLDDATMRHRAPSIFAEQAASTTSQKYRFIPTAHVVDVMRGQGYVPVHVAESRTRVEERVGYTRHMIVFRQQGAELLLQQLTAEIVVTNAHDGTSAYKLYAGFFRQVCYNGLRVSDATIPSITLRHTGDGDFDRDLIYGANSLMADVPRALEMVQTWKRHELTTHQQHAYARAAHMLRWDPEDAPIGAERLLDVRRPADRGDDVWTTYNRVQEHLTKGGDEYITPTRHQTRRTAAIRDIGEHTRLNKALWTLTEELARS